MPRVIVVSSGKGGVGKTTLVANLSAALAGRGQNVVAMDANITTSNLGIHVGIAAYGKTLQDVIMGRARIRDVMITHPLGFRIIPADVTIKKLMQFKSYHLMDVIHKMTDADFVLIDCAAGIGKDVIATLEAADELLLVTNPEVPALTDALKLGHVAQQLGTRVIGTVVNRVRGDALEVALPDVAEFLSMPIVGTIPEDNHVRRAIHHHIPVVALAPGSRAAQHIKQIAAGLCGEDYRIRRFFGLW